WLKKNNYYHNNLLKFYKFVVTQSSRVLQINCKNGYVLNAVNPSFGVGLDVDVDSLSSARERYQDIQFFSSDINDLEPQIFDYIILTSVTMEEYDIQDLFLSLRPFCDSSTRIIIDTYSYLWEPVLWVTQKLGLRRPTDFKNWISQKDLHNFLQLAGFDVVTTSRHTLFPMYIPILSSLLNSFFVHVPIIKRLCLHEVTIARAIFPERDAKKYKVSVIVPCKNEKGNVEAAVTRCPDIGSGTEIIFVEGGSQDGTLDEIIRVSQKYPEKNIQWCTQEGKGKGDAVRKGFAQAKGDILMILDADLTVRPEELPKFVDALVRGKGEFINGSRLIYGMESDAMRFLNLLANYFFGLLFSWLLSQKIKDTLCGTKVLFAADYKKIADNRKFFGDFDPFGDFDLLFGAAKLNLKIIDMPVHYKNRTYGSTQIRRFMHGFILLGMSIIALKKFKFRR
ncbi:glycosyltransferase, partial [bacterium]|nr:glycosyltransferase [bacterium]